VIVLFRLIDFYLIVQFNSQIFLGVSKCCCCFCQTKTLLVGNREEAVDVTQRCIREFHITVGFYIYKYFPLFLSMSVTLSFSISLRGLFLATYC